MNISRRDFLKYVGASALALGLGEWHLAELERALAQTTGAPVLWLSGSACTGCSVSLLNAVNPSVDQLLTSTLSLRYHSTLMAAAGDLAVSAARSTAQAGNYILIVEGAIPTAAGGRYCYVWDEGGQPVTMASALTSLASSARHIVAVGTCAAYGGIPRTYSLTSAVGVGAFLGRAVINLPGCPAHPDWIIGTLSQLILGNVPALDANGRPVAYYGNTVHSACPRRTGAKATNFGQDGLCMNLLGCKGDVACADCSTRLWSNRQNWCVGVNSLCIGCTEPQFPAFPLHR